MVLSTKSPFASETIAVFPTPMQSAGVRLCASVEGLEIPPGAPTTGSHLRITSPREVRYKCICLVRGQWVMSREAGKFLK